MVFTPQDELHGYTPQRIVRNDELGSRNPMPPEHMHRLYGGDQHFQEFDQEMARMAEEEGEEHSWGFGLAPDMSLLDEYDPECYDERWRIDDERWEAKQAAEKVEAERYPLTGGDDPLWPRPWSANAPS